MTHSADTTVDLDREVATLWPHNAWATEDLGIEMALHKAFGNAAGRDDLPIGTPLLGFVNDHAPAVPLYDALFNGGERWEVADLYAACDRCCADSQPKHALWVATGETVVSVHCCEGCRRQLDADFTEPRLVWR